MSDGGREAGRSGRRKEERERGRGISCTVYMTAERSVVPHQTEVGRAGQWSPACPHCRASLFLRERGEETQMGQTPEPRPPLLEGGRDGGREGVKEKTTKNDKSEYVNTTCTLYSIHVHVCVHVHVLFMHCMYARTCTCMYKYMYMYSVCANDFPSPCS